MTVTLKTDEPVTATIEYQTLNGYRVPVLCIRVTDTHVHRFVLQEVDEHGNWIAPEPVEDNDGDDDADAATNKVQRNG